MGTTTPNGRYQPSLDGENSPCVAEPGCDRPGVHGRRVHQEPEQFIGLLRVPSRPPGRGAKERFDEGAGLTQLGLRT